MIPLLMALRVLLCVALLRRHRAQERTKELLWMKRHAAEYIEQHKSA